MAMNKKEQAEFEAMRKEVRVARALRFTDPIEPDVPPPAASGLSTGFLFGGSRVDVACSSSVHHGFGRTDKTSTQRPRWLYSTKERALRAMRNRMEHEFAEELAKVDRQIEEEVAASQPAKKEIA